MNPLLRALRLTHVVDHFLSNVADASEVGRGRIVVLFSFILAIWSAGFIVWLLPNGLAVGATVTGCNALLAATIPVYLRRTGRIDRSAHALALAYTVLLTAISSWSGGAYGIALPMLMMVPFAASFIISLPAGLAWAGLTTAVIAVVMVMQLALGVPMDPVFGQPLLSVAGGTSAIAGIWLGYLVATAYSDYRDGLERRLTDAAQLRAMVLELSAMEANLDAAAQRLGEGDDNLTRQMTDEAVAGQRKSRATMVRVSELVGRFEVLDELVERLLERAVTIEQLAAVSRRASRRLDLLALSAGLEAAQTDEKAFAIIAEEIGRVAHDANAELRQIAAFAAELRDRLEEVGAESDAVAVLGQEAQSTALASEASFNRLTALVGEVDHATTALRQEARHHLTRVRDIAAHTRKP